MKSFLASISSGSSLNMLGDASLKSSWPALAASAGANSAKIAPPAPAGESNAPAAPATSSVAVPLPFMVSSPELTNGQVEETPAYKSSLVVFVELSWPLQISSGDLKNTTMMVMLSEEPFFLAKAVSWVLT